MTNVIKNTLFYKFHSDTSGGVFNSNNVDLDIIGCSFQYCTANVSGACFIFRYASIKVIKTCFYHSQVLEFKENVYGNAFSIENSIYAFIQEVSAYSCGYDSSSCTDSTIAISNTTLEAEYINCSHCATHGGANSIAINYNSRCAKVNYLASISPYGNTCFHIVLMFAKSDMNHLICINSSNVSWMFWLEESDSLTIKNGIFIDPNPDKILTDNRYSLITLIDCISNVAMDQLSNPPTVIDKSSISFDIIKEAEICNVQKIQTCMVMKSFINLNVINILSIFICKY